MRFQTKRRRLIQFFSMFWDNEPSSEAEEQLRA